MSSYPEYLLDELKRLVQEAMVREKDLQDNSLLPCAHSMVRDQLSYIRKHISGLASVARKAGATDGQIAAVLNPLFQEEERLCPKHKTPLVDVCSVKRGHEVSYCPECINEERKDD